MEKPSKPEDEYFAQEDVERLRKLAFQQKQALAAQEREALRKLHHMKCPNCGLDLHNVEHGPVHLATCFNCHGVFLQEGQLAKLLAEGRHRAGEHSIIEAVLNLFKKETGA